MKVSRKGQVTIPKQIRERLDLHPGTDVRFHVEQGRVFLARSPHGTRRGQDLVDRMRGAATARATTNEIMALTRE